MANKSFDAGNFEKASWGIEEVLKRINSLKTQTEESQKIKTEALELKRLIIEALVSERLIKKASAAPAA